ncbi:hypothetical protein [Methyloferula stellata]|uniref:hypothetical protein n=1 Tax=Methyloferula stellata TaxID=876270 RepID=UPI00037F6DC6|nr:hypothetical protein [Methyloferula stellata]
MRMIGRYGLAITLLLIAVATAAQADPARDSSRASGKSSAASSATQAQRPAVGATGQDAPATDESHSFSGFYGGLQGGFATGRDTSSGFDRHP